MHRTHPLSVLADSNAVRTRSLGWSFWLCLFTALCFPRPAMAQGMSFSTYTDYAIGGETTIYMYANTSDNSWGVTHWNYTTTARIYSPSNRSGSSQSSGLQASASIAISGETGYYTMVTTGTYQCSGIFGGVASYGSGINVPLSAYYGRYKKSTENDCSLGRTKYEAHACDHACMADTKCFYASSAFVQHIGYVLGSTCTPGYAEEWANDDGMPCAITPVF